MSELIPFLKAVQLVEVADLIRIVGLGVASYHSHPLDVGKIVFLHEDDQHQEYGFSIDSVKNADVKQEGCKLTFIDEDGEDLVVRLYILTPLIA